MKRILAILCLFILPFMVQAQPRGNAALAEQFLGQGDYARAAQLYQQLYSRDPSFRNYSGLLKALKAEKQYTEAEQLIQQRCLAYPEDYRYPLELGALYSESGDKEKARGQFETVLGLLPDKPSLVSEIAYTLYELGEYQFAIDALLKARKSLHGVTVFYYELARLYYLVGRPSSMIHELLTMVRHRPDYLQSIKGQLQYYLKSEEEYQLLEEMLEKQRKQYSGTLVYSELLVWRYLQEKDFEKALALAQELYEEDQNGERIMRIGDISASNSDYSSAAAAWRFLSKEGAEWYIPARSRALKAEKAQLLSEKPLKTSKLEALCKNYQQLLGEIGQKPEAVPVLRELARIEGQALQQPRRGIKTLEKAIELAKEASIAARCKMELAHLYLLAEEPWEASLLYGQVEKAFNKETIGQEARFHAARLSYFMGEFEWALAQLNELKAATSQPIANDALNLSLLIAEHAGADSNNTALRMYARAGYLAFLNRPREALRLLDSIPQLFPAHGLQDDMLMSRAAIFSKMDKTAEAIEALKKVAENYAYDLWADDALFRLGELYENQQKSGQAMVYYEKLLLDHPGSLYVAETRKRFRRLRGDKVEQTDGARAAPPPRKKGKI